MIHSYPRRRERPDAHRMNLPNRLTVLRIVLTPAVAVLLVAEWPLWQLASILLIGALALTDLLDGYLARRRNQVTPLGVLLDPIADKFLISTIFICLVARGLSPTWVAIAIVGREFAVTALRMIALERGESVPVNSFGKAKMHVQVYAVMLVLLGAWHAPFAPIGILGLWIATAITLWSGFVYYRRARIFPTAS